MVNGARWRVLPQGRSLSAAAANDRDERQMVVDNGVVVICAGGGGIPTAYDENCKLYGVEAVVDKDLASGLLAKGLDAEMFVMLTDVANVYAGFGTQNQRAIKAAHPDVLETGQQSAIGKLSDLSAIMSGEAGTLISNEVDGICYRE